MKKGKRKIKKSFLLISVALISLLVVVLLQITRMELMKDVTELQVDLDSELSYTLTVTYDGVDRNGAASIDSSGKPKIIKIDSDYIYVEDVLPDGLIFEKFNFEGNDNVSIGSSKRDETSEGTCNGYVVNDSKGSTDPKSNHGLHYDEASRKVTFKIKNLTAGCKLSVGIVTKTPTSIEGNRKDFYNTATAWESTQMVYSNMVHAWIQKKNNVTMHKVTYQYTGNVPSGVTPPVEQEYAVGTTVGVVGEPKVEGYTFNGWTSVVSINNGKFTMPDSDVVIIGSFTENTKYEVSYTIDGIQPDGYVVPSTKSYYEKSTVKVDSMKSGDTFKGYRFLGWESTDIEISKDSDFAMPSKNVRIVGKWEQVKYKVTYDFYEGVRPPNYQDILNTINNQENTYIPGSSVTLPNIEDVEGYHFQGWYESNGFLMPEHDVTVYGEWMERKGLFSPTITKEIIGPKEYYYPGDTISFKITVNNNADYPIEKVVVRDNNPKASFYAMNNSCVSIRDSDTGEVLSTSCKYEQRTDHIIEITSIAAHSSENLYGSYLVTDDDFGEEENEVEILGAITNNNYSLDTTKEYKDSVKFKIVSRVNICKNVDVKGIEKDFQFKITNQDASYETWVSLNDGECKTVFLEPGNYKIKELIPQEFNLASSTIGKNKEPVTNYNNDQLFQVEEFTEYNISFNNEYKKKGFLHSFGRVINTIKNRMSSLELI